jgi:hypothetical protein
MVEDIKRGTQYAVEAPRCGKLSADLGSGSLRASLVRLQLDYY